ncbi:MAG: hypothetical protein KF855_03730 [Acidobacteria bacterium]|nr:hypothetical protein [Acidobacteriota bacterium]
MRDHNFLIGGITAVAGYMASGFSWLYASAYGVMFYVFDPEVVKTYGPLLVAILTALIGKSVDVWLKLRDEKKSKQK